MSKALAVNATVSGRQRFFDFLYKWGMLLTVVLLIAAFGLASDNFLDPFNIINILRSIAIVTVIAIGVSISLTIGGFDLSCRLHRLAGQCAGDFAVCLARLRHHRGDCCHPGALYLSGAV